MGSLVWWFLLMAGTSIILPGASFVFHWPLLFSLLGLGWMLISSPPDRPANSTRRSIFNIVIFCLCAVPGIILVVPVIYQIFVGLTLNWSFLVIALLVLLFGLLLPQLRLITTPFKWAVPGASAVVAIVLLVAGASTPRPRTASQAASSTH
jgi:hypothetical protein